MDSIPSDHRIKELTKLPDFRFLIKHAKFGFILFALGIVLVLLLLFLHAQFSNGMSEYLWSALLSIPITLICMGIFSVCYEYYIRNTFMAYMRSVYWAWNTGVTVFPTHRHAPDRVEVLERANSEVRLMSTTFSQYFGAIKDLLDRKVNSGIIVRIIIYDPDSKAIQEKAEEEGATVEDFQDEIKSVCRRFIGPLIKKYGDLIQIKFCPFNTPFGITIIDDKEMVLSLNIYGLARSKNQTPCLIIKNTYDEDSVFTLYEKSFEAIWKKLDKSIPKSVKHYFEDITSAKEE